MKPLNRFLIDEGISYHPKVDELYLYEKCSFRLVKNVKNKYEYINEEYDELKKRPTLFRFFSHCLRNHKLKIYNNCVKYGLVFSVLLLDSNISILLSIMINNERFDSDGYSKKFNKLFDEYASFRNLFKISNTINKLNFKYFISSWGTL